MMPMHKVYYSDDMGDDYDFVSSHPDVATAEAEADRLNAILYHLVMRGKAFESTEGPIEERVEAECDFIRAQPEWQTLCEAIPSVFTEDEDPFVLGFNMFPTIDVRDENGRVLHAGRRPESKEKT